MAKASKAGIGVWLEMFGSDGKPVAQALAESRASVCAECPENDRVTNIRDYFIDKVVAGITAIYEMLRNLSLSTSRDAELGVCKLCFCPLRAKVHCKLAHITKHMTADTRAKLPDACWIKKES